MARITQLEDDIKNSQYSMAHYEKSLKSIEEKLSRLNRNDFLVLSDAVAATRVTLNTLFKRYKK